MSQADRPPFARVADPAARVRVVLVGAGGMGRAWVGALTDNPEVELVGIVDLDVPLARAAAAGLGSEIAVGTSVAAVAGETGAQAVVNVTVPVAHHPVSTEALLAGLPVLSEKPITPTVAQALSLAAAAEVTGRLLMASQSRRYYASLLAFREQVRGLGRLGVATTQFFKAPRFGGFRDVMDHVLLVDMAIHPFDVARYLLDAEPVSVYCDEYNPSWSWYAGNAAATALFEFDGGVRYIYSGSWCSEGLETSWNGSWRVNGESGTASWDGDRRTSVQQRADAPTVTDDSTPATAEEIRGSLVEFIDAIRTGHTPSGEIHANLISLAMVEGAVLSAQKGTRINIADVLEDGYAAALAAEQNDDVRTVLAGWGSAAAGLAVAAGATARG